MALAVSSGHAPEVIGLLAHATNKDRGGFSRGPYFFFVGAGSVSSGIAPPAMAQR